MKLRLAWAEVRRMGCRSGVRAAMLVGVLVAACGTTSSSSVEGETHWLKRCSMTPECTGGQRCLCGVCTLSCSDDSECSGLAASARCADPSSTDYADECDEALPGLCVRDADLEMTSATQTTATAASTGGAASTSTANGSTSDNSTSDNSTSNGATAASSTATTAGNAGAGGQDQDDCPPLPGDVPGCECWRDADCSAGSLCYFADCVSERLGECRMPPVDGCYDDRDCDEGTCLGAMPIGCSAASPQGAGVCGTDTCPPEAPCEAGQSSGEGCRCYDGAACVEATGPLGSGMCRASDGSCAACRCASPDTPIATPGGPRPIAELRAGDLVYSVDGAQITSVPLLLVHRTPVYEHHVLSLEFENGASFSMSGEHPTVDGRLLSELAVGMTLDHQTITRIERIPYGHAYTYDILPDSDSGGYFADGILVGSTLGKATRTGRF